MDRTITFDDPTLSRISQNASSYNNNASAWDMVLDEGKIMGDGQGSLILTLTNGTGTDAPRGTKLSTTNYMLYGEFYATMKVSKWPGVVTAFISMSDVKDEIDWEWTGNKTKTALSNFFYLGEIPSTGQGSNGNETELSADGSAAFHEYGIKWAPEQLDWLVDGNVVRTVRKVDTLDADGIYHYPYTPTRVQLSIWPGGIESLPKGTQDWAGGLIDWNDSDYLTNGYFYAVVKSLRTVCADPTVDATAHSYVYTNATSNAAPVFAYSNQTGISSATSTRLVPLLDRSFTVTSLLILITMGICML